MIAYLVRPLARPQPLGVRVTVPLIPKAAAGLLRLQDRTRLSKTDVVNRAITLYEFVDERTRAGQEILIRDTQTQETQLVRLI
jgi:hypothetical protein